ncbi:MAG: hypothetical protein GVY17_08010 [Cyanobacteria bacterium]|jgi:hypothetical protein|nr:hypothetical protein [Cyanobacteria bacterium GSL.Bin21]
MKQLNGDETYPCPVCRSGEVRALPLMEDSFSCQFCQHLFQADFSQQLLTMMDSEIPLSWYWNGKRWSSPQRKGIELGWEYIVAGMLFLILPPFIVGTGAYLFPPVPGTPLAWLPTAWTILTLLTHLGILLWLITEYYQFPVVLYVRAVLRQRIET